MARLQLIKPLPLLCPYCGSGLKVGTVLGTIESDGTGLVGGVACHATFDATGKPITLPDGTDIATATLAQFTALYERIIAFLDATKGQGQVRRADLIDAVTPQVP